MATATQEHTTTDPQLQHLMINSIRTLSIDAVQKANSGHPGAPLDMAPVGYTLFTKYLRYNPKNPAWPNRDRFVLSAGHASMLLYSLLYLTGYDLGLGDLEQFRQYGSKTPGHPEYGLTPGAEVTTGPLGQGFANGVGMAIAEAYLAAHFNRPGFEIVDHDVYAIVSDGDLEEGVTSEAASLAGHLKLGRLIYLYDENQVQLSGPTDTNFTENVLERFDAYGWHTQRVGDGNDVAAISAAIENARKETDRPSLIAVRTVIGFASPVAGSYKAHGEPLGANGVEETKQKLGWPADKSFYVPKQALEAFREAVDRGAKLEHEWDELFRRWQQAHPDLAHEWDVAAKHQLPDGWDSDLPTYKVGDSVATREAGGEAMNAIARHVPTFMGGDADLSPSTKTKLQDYGDFEPGNYGGRNIHYGVREHAMGSISNGIAVNGLIRTYGATFFNFSDYQKPAVRLAALMEIPNIFVYTHDSILLGEDGPTHQPIEQLATLRATPNLVVMRPADATESVSAWTWIMQEHERPVAVVLTRQKIPVLDRSGAQGNLEQGAYILQEAEGGNPEVILIGTGSEVQLCVGARSELEKQGIRTRVVSFPSWELFEAQSEEYRRKVLPPEVTARVSVEAAATIGWCRWVGERGASIGIDRFGASAPAKDVAQHLGLTVDNVVRSARRVLRR